MNNKNSCFKYIIVKTFLYSNKIVSFLLRWRFTWFLLLKLGLAIDLGSLIRLWILDTAYWLELTCNEFLIFKSLLILALLELWIQCRRLIFW